MQDNYPRESWVLKTPIYDCPFSGGKCSLRHENKNMDCIFKNDEWCKYRVIEDKEK